MNNLILNHKSLFGSLVMAMMFGGLANAISLSGKSSPDPLPSSSSRQTFVRVPDNQVYHTASPTSASANNNQDYVYSAPPVEPLVKKTSAPTTHQDNVYTPPVRTTAPSSYTTHQENVYTPPVRTTAPSSYTRSENVYTPPVQTFSPTPFTQSPTKNPSYDYDYDYQYDSVESSSEGGGNSAESSMEVFSVESSESFLG